MSCRRLRRIGDPGAAVPIISQLVIVTILRALGALGIKLISRTAILWGSGLLWDTLPTRSSPELFPFLMITLLLLRLWRLGGELLNLGLFDLRLAAYTPSASWKLFWRWWRPLRAAIVFVIRVFAVEGVCASKRRGFLHVFRSRFISLVGSSREGR